MLASNVAVAALPGTSIDPAFVQAPDHIGAGCGLSNGVDFITWIIASLFFQEVEKSPGIASFQGLRYVT